MSKKLIIFIIILALVLIIVFAGFFIFKTDGGVGTIETDSSLKDIKAKGELVIGSDIPYGLMEFFNEAGEPDGLDMDVAKELARRLGVKAKIVDVEWDDLFEKVQNREVDIAISMIAYKPEREKIMLFSTPYFNGGQSILIRKTEEGIKDPKDLAGKKVGSQVETTCMDEAKKYADHELLKSYPSFDEKIINDLKNGEIDAIVIGYEATIGIINENEDLKLAGPPFTEDFSGVVTHLKNRALIDEINFILRDMKREGILKEIEKKWMDIEE